MSYHTQRLEALSEALQARYPDLRITAFVQKGRAGEQFRTLAFRGTAEQLIAHGLAERVGRDVPGCDPPLRYRDAFGTFGMGSDQGEEAYIYHHIDLDPEVKPTPPRRFPNKQITAAVARICKRLARRRRRSPRAS